MAFPNDDLTTRFFWCSCGRGPYRRAALAIRYASARAARDFGKSAAENSDETGRKQQPVCRLFLKFVPDASWLGSAETFSVREGVRLIERL